MQQWRKATEIRAYVTAAAKALELDDEWKTWALATADAIDPLNDIVRDEVDSEE